MPEWMALQPADPDSVGPYRLHGRLGTGGQGTVYVGDRAEGPQGQRVALKLLHPHLVTDPTARARFLGEVEIAKRVAPFCTAQVLDSGTEGGQPYIVTEYVAGPSLRASVAGTGPRSGAALQRLAINTATALDAVHQAGIIHRDFKPGNVLLGPDGPVVIDFGIAGGLDHDESLTPASLAIGSPSYMAPEQINGGEAGPAADLFAWGATMVYAATGAPAFTGGSISAIMHSVLHDEPDLDHLDGKLRELVSACLAKDSSLRPTAAQVVERLRALPAPAFHAASHPVPTGAAAAGTVVGGGGQGGAGTGDDTTVDQTRTRASPATRRRRATLVAAVVGAAALAVAAVLGGLVATSALAPSQREGPRPGAMQAPRPGASATGTAHVTAGQPSGSPNPAGPTGKQGTGGGSNPGGGGGAGSGTKPTASRKPAPGGGQKPPSGQKPAPGPKTLGILSQSDLDGYCQSKGYAGSGGSLDNPWCYGPGGEPVSLTSVCRWKHPRYRNVVADETTCKSS